MKPDAMVALLQRTALPEERTSVPDGTSILDQTVSFVRRFVVLNEQQLDAIALWIAHTHAIEAADTTPYLAVTSAEKRSGRRGSWRSWSCLSGLRSPPQTSVTRRCFARSRR